MKEKISELVQANRNNYGLIAGVVMLLSILLPWYNSTYNSIGAFFTNTAPEHYVFGIATIYGFIALVISAAGLYLYYTNHKYSVFAGVANCLLGFYLLLKFSVAFGLFIFVIAILR